MGADEQLSAVDVPDYLLACGLISPRSIVEGDLVVRDFSGRNRTFSAECMDADSYLLKQNNGVSMTTVAHEAEVYRSLSTNPAISPFMPRFHGYDPDARVLIVEFFRDGEDLGAYDRNRRRPHIRAASAIGAILGILHDLPLEQSDAPVTYRRPGVLSLHQPGLHLVSGCSRATVELVRIIQATAEFGEELDALGRDWSVASLIHHDVRFKNLMWTAPSTTGRMSRLKLIDWELACPGDPAWDIGSAMANYLSLWLGSIPVTGSSVTELSIELARCPLSGIQDAIRACWAAYVKQRRLDDDVVEVLLSAAVRFAAARLVQTAFEATQDAGSLATDVVLHLQVALNVLQRPRQAVVHLLGLP